MRNPESRNPKLAAKPNLAAELSSLIRDQLSIVYLPIGDLVPYTKNARIHSIHQIGRIASSIREFGFINPLIIDALNRILVGIGRFKAAQRLGLKVVPTIYIDGLSEDQKRAYILADNQLVLKGAWDQEILAIELEHLLTVDSIDITVTGFEVAEIDAILEEVRSDPSENPAPEPIVDKQSISQLGDLWLLGKHRVICGDALHQSTYRALLGHHHAAMVFADPPYNVRIDGHATGNGRIRHREFQMASGDLSTAEFVAFLTEVVKCLAASSTENSVHYLCMDWKHVGELLAAARLSYSEFLNLCVWVKDNGGMGSFYRSQHELIAVFRKGKGSHRNNIQLGKFGRNRTNVWKYPGIQTLSKQSDEGNLLAMHPTVKPIAMVADAILDCTARGEVVLDPFLGSGTTLMAAERVGRICYGIEIDPIYIDVAIRRWQKLTGESAVHAVSGKRFDEIAAEQEVQHG